MEGAGLDLLCVAEGHRHHVGGYQRDHPRPQASVQLHQLVLAQSPFDWRDAGDEQKRDEHQISTGHRREAAHGDEHAAGGGELAHRGDGNHQGHADEQADGGEHAEEPREELSRPGGGGGAWPSELSVTPRRLPRPRCAEVLDDLAAHGLPLCFHCSHSFARLRFARRAGRGSQVLTEVVTGEHERTMNGGHCPRRGKQRTRPPIGATAIGEVLIMNWSTRVRGALRRDKVRRACARLRDGVHLQRRDSA